MNTLYILDVPENVPVVKVAQGDEQIEIDKIGPYFEIMSDADIVIDRRATGCRHAVWYSFVAAIGGGRIVQHDKDALRISGS